VFRPNSAATVLGTILGAPAVGLAGPFGALVLAGAGTCAATTLATPVLLRRSSIPRVPAVIISRLVNVWVAAWRAAAIAVLLGKLRTGLRLGPEASASSCTGIDQSTATNLGAVAGTFE
jgi:hypothetical protein